MPQRLPPAFTLHWPNLPDLLISLQWLQSHSVVRFWRVYSDVCGHCLIAIWQVIADWKSALNPLLTHAYVLPLCCKKCVPLHKSCKCYLGTNQVHSGQHLSLEDVCWKRFLLLSADCWRSDCNRVDSECSGNWVLFTMLTYAYSWLLSCDMEIVPYPLS